jgi:hypothetical protein
MAGTGRGGSRRVTPRRAAMGRGYASALWVLLVLGSATGCSVVVGGSMRPAPGLAPRPLTGHSVRQVLLDSAELSQAFGQSFTVDLNFPPESGGAELLGVNVDTPPECGGVAMMLLKESYADSDVRDVAHKSWLNSSPHPVVMAVQEAVVALPTATAADAQFAALARQWGRCNGASMTIAGDDNFTFRVNHIQEEDSVLAATVDHLGRSVMIPAAQAIGVRVNCIIEVEIVYYGRGHRDGSAGHTPTAADTARLLMNKVSSLS